MKKLLLFALLLTSCAYAQERRGHLVGTGSPLLQSPIPACTAGDLYIDSLTGAHYSAKGYPCVWIAVGTGTVAGLSGDCSGSGSGTISTTCTNVNLTGKTNCSDPTKVWSPAAGQCIAAGGAPSGTNGVLQLANTGGTALASDSTISADTTNHNVISPQLNGFKYAGPLQTGGGNNGIVNSLANQTTVIAEPTYTGETGLNWTNWAFSGFNQYHMQREYQGQTIDFYHNWANQANPLWSDGNQPAHLFNCMVDFNTQIQGHRNCFNMRFYDTSPGYSVGNTAPGYQGWYITDGMNIDHNISGAGLAETFTMTQAKTGIGDNATFYAYNVGTGGWTAASDEGTKAGAFSTIEASTPFTGIITSGASTGSTAIRTGSTTNNGNQGVGKYVIDLGQGGTLNVPPNSGTVASIATSSLGNWSTVQFATGTTAVSNAWGKPTSNIATPQNINAPFSTSETFTITLTSGAFDTTHLACWAGPYADCAVPTAVGTATTTQSVTMPLRHGHGTTNTLFQGGPAGDQLELPYYTVIGTSAVTMRYLFDVVGATTSTSLEVVLWKQGGPSAIPAATFPDLFNTLSITAISSTGTVVTITWSNGSSLFHPYRFNQSTFYITGASDSAFNTTCTGAAWVGNTMTCTIAGLTGTHTATTATAVLSTFQGVPSNTWQTWHAAEILDVQDYTTNPIAVTGNFLLAPNAVPFVTGDKIEVPNHSAAEQQGLSVYNAPLNPMGAAPNGITTSMQGYGVTSAGAFYRGTNLNGDGIYQGFGGLYLPPDGVNIGGAINNLISANHLPANGAAIVSATGTTAQLNDQSLSFFPFTFGGHLGQSFLQYAPYSGGWTWQAQGGISLLPGGPVTSSGTIFANLGLVVGNGAGFTPQIGANQMGFNASAGTGFYYTVGSSTSQIGGLNMTSFTSNVGSNHVWMSAAPYTGATVSPLIINGPIQVAAPAGGFIVDSVGKVTAPGLQVGTNTSSSTTTPVDVSFGGTFGSNTIGTTGNCKWDLYNDGAGTKYCIGMSVGLMEFQAPTGGAYGWYINNTKVAGLTNTGLTTPQQITSTLATGTAPLSITSTTPVSNLTLSAVSQLPAPFSIANVTVTLPTSAITANTCTGASTVTMTGLTTSMTFTTAFATDPSAVVGWGSSGGLNFVAWPTANTLNWRVCNATGSSITPGAMTLNVGAR